MAVLFEKNKKPNGPKIGKKIRNEMVTNFTLFHIKTECVYNILMLVKKNLSLNIPNSQIFN